MKKIKNCIIKADNINLVPAEIEDFQFGYDLWKLTQKEFLEKINDKWEENEKFEIENYKDERNTNIENNYLIKYNDKALKFYIKLGFKIYDENNSMFNCLEYIV